MPKRQNPYIRPSISRTDATRFIAAIATIFDPNLGTDHLLSDERIVVEELAEKFRMLLNNQTHQEVIKEIRNRYKTTD